MAFQIETRGEKKYIHAFTKKVCDIPGGVTICTAELGGDILYEGTPIAKGADNMYHVVKTAKVAIDANTSATSYTVNKGHHFKAGDAIMAKTGAKAYAITAITTNGDDPTLDDITVGTTLGVSLKKGATLMHATKEGESGSALAFSPLALVGESMMVKEKGFAKNNLFVSAITMGQCKESNMPAVSDTIKSALKGIIFI